MPVSIALKRRHHLVFLASVFCFWLCTYSYVPIFSLYLEQIPFTYAAIGIILGSYGITQVLLRFPLGVLLDSLRHLRKHFYVGGFVVAILSGIILLSSTSFAWVLTGRLLAGVTAAMWVMATIMYADYFDPGQSGRAMGTLQFLTVMPQFLSMVTAGILVEQFGWSIPFWVGIVAAGIGLLFALFIKEVPQEIENHRSQRLGKQVKAVLSIKHLLPLTFVSLFTHALLFISIFGFTPVYANAHGVREGQLIWLMAAFFIPHAAASLGVAFFNVSKRNEIRLIVLSLIVACFTFFCMPFATTLATISLLHGVIGLTVGVVLPLLLSQIASLPQPTLKTSVMGFYQSVYAIGIFIGPYGAGFVAEHIGIAHIFTLAGIVSLLALAITMPLLRRAKNETTKSDEAS
ncbi:MFS transporter [Shouchella clausii]|uniref:MFS transporter n=1 Tax=Shouchella clausii TaxID=79880 RepID=UPI0020B26A9E|nr:MFS transporter [Shouchella clausii]MCY1106087.1 MFS transporter [Shouchella clausii]MED4158400.1 MFS transporter [Shouchella clausii]MED4177782.1 MFS transporter [Shouchella clausii]